MRKIKKKVLVFSGMGILLGWLVLNIKNFFFCRGIYAGYGFLECASATQKDVFLFIELLSIPLFIVTSILFFLRDDIFISWFKFALVALIISNFIIFFSNSSNGGIMQSDRANFTFILAVLFLIVSIIIIVYRTIYPGNTR